MSITCIFLSSLEGLCLRPPFFFCEVNCPQASRKDAKGSDEVFFIESKTDVRDTWHLIKALCLAKTKALSVRISNIAPCIFTLVIEKRKEIASENGKFYERKRYKKAER